MTEQGRYMVRKEHNSSDTNYAGEKQNMTRSKDRFLETAYRNFTEAEIGTLEILLMKMMKNFESNERMPTRKDKPAGLPGAGDRGFDNGSGAGKKRGKRNNK
jgi:hypothetical protein